MFYHEDNEGKEIPFIELTDEHLKGIINRYCYLFEDAKRYLSNTGCDFIDTLYPKKSTMNFENAKGVVYDFEENIAPYVYEAALRDLDTFDEIRNRLWKLLERDEIKKEIGKTNALEYIVE